MKVLGIDYGTKRVGVSIGDTDTRVAVPLSVLTIKDLGFKIKEIVVQEGVGLIVVGLPRRTEGGKSEMQKKVEKFIKELHVGVHIVTADERFTTKEVERAMRSYGKARKGVDKDAAAAALILQSWLDAH